MKNQTPFIIELLLGISLLCASIFVKSSYYSTILSSMGIGIMVASALQLVRIIYWKNPKRKQAYEEKKQQAHIDCVDERKQFLRMKSGQITCYVMTFLLLILAFVLALFQAEAWVIGMLFSLFLFQFLFGAIVLRILEKRM